MQVPLQTIRELGSAEQHDTRQDFCMLRPGSRDPGDLLVSLTEHSLSYIDYTNRSSFPTRMLTVSIYGNVLHMPAISFPGEPATARTLLALPLRFKDGLSWGDRCIGTTWGSPWYTQPRESRLHALCSTHCTHCTNALHALQFFELSHYDSRFLEAVSRSRRTL
jgi:hypothetical protein